MPTRGARIRRLSLLAPVLLVALLLAGCQSVPTEQLEEQLGGLTGVEEVDVDASRVEVTLAADLAPADVQTAILGVRDAAVAGHPLGDGVDLVVVLPLGPRDNGGSAPWQAYAYARWVGTTGADAFAQQVAFVASLADWQTVLTTPARILQVGFQVQAVPSDPATESPAPTEAPADGSAPPAPQIVTLHVGQPVGSGNAETDIEALIGELAGLWVASGGVAEGIEID
jgi:hypothetical protein